MIQRRGIHGAPADHAVDGDWPQAALAADAPVAAHYARHIAARLQAELAEGSLSQLARRADVNRSTLQGLLAGRSWPDVVTVAKLEAALGRRLWPEQPPDPR